MRFAALPIILLSAGAAAAETVAPPDLPPGDTWVRTDGGTIRVLDKQKAQSHVLALNNGQTATFESLSITLVACVARPPELPPNAAGFVQITDNRAGEPGFHGWMLAGQPGLASLQSPVYSVRVVACLKPTDAQIAAAIPPKPPAPPPQAEVPSIAAPQPSPVPPRPAAGSDLNPPPGQDLDNPTGQ